MGPAFMGKQLNDNIQRKMKLKDGKTADSFTFKGKFNCMGEINYMQVNLVQTYFQ